MPRHGTLYKLKTAEHSAIVEGLRMLADAVDRHDPSIYGSEGGTKLTADELDSLTEAINCCDIWTSKEV